MASGHSWRDREDVTRTPCARARISRPRSSRPRAAPRAAAPAPRHCPGRRPRRRRNAGYPSSGTAPTGTCLRLHPREADEATQRDADCSSPGASTPPAPTPSSRPRGARHRCRVPRPPRRLCVAEVAGSPPGAACPVSRDDLLRRTRASSRARTPRSSFVSRMKIPRKRNAARKASVLKSLSCRRCMKKAATSDPFIVAMAIAMTMLAEPKS